MERGLFSAVEAWGMRFSISEIMGGVVEVTVDRTTELLGGEEEESCQLGWSVWLG